MAVEGNIGCGKSTFLRYFEGISPKIEVALEPIELWNNVKGHKLFVIILPHSTMLLTGNILRKPLEMEHSVPKSSYGYINESTDRVPGMVDAILCRFTIFYRSDNTNTAIGTLGG